MKLSYVTKTTTIPILFPFILFATLFSTSLPAQASTISIQAKVAAPLPTTAAIITSLTNQQHVVAPFAQVAGICGNAAYVTLYNSGNLAGIGACKSSGFTIPVTLSPQVNLLQAHVYNSTDDEGPQAAPIIIYRDMLLFPAVETPLLPLAPEVIPSANANLPKEIIPPMRLLYAYTHQTYGANEPWSATIYIKDGIAPFSINVNWTDGSVSQYQSTSPDVSVSHSFKSAGAYQPIVSVTDSRGEKVTLQLLAVIQDPKAVPAPDPLREIIVPAAVSLGVITVIGAIAKSTVLASGIRPRWPW